MDYLTREENRRHALEKIRRIPIETSPIPPKLEGLKLLTFPFIYGLNLESNATGWSDLMSGLGGSATSASNVRGDGESSTTPSVRLMMTRMGEIFYGLCFQRGMGTPSVLSDDIIRNSDDSKYVEGAMLNIFLGTPTSLNSGLFNPTFAEFWKDYFGSSEEKRINYVDMQSMYGVEACKVRLEKMKKDMQPRKARSGRGGRGGGRGGGNMGFFTDDQDDDDDDEDDNDSENIPHELFKHDRRFQSVTETDRGKKMQELLETGDEKISIIVCRITRSKANLAPENTSNSSNFVAAAAATAVTGTTVDSRNASTTTEPESTVISGNVRNPFSFLDETEGEEEEGERGEILEEDGGEFPDLGIEGLFPSEDEGEEQQIEIPEPVLPSQSPIIIITEDEGELQPQQQQKRVNTESFLPFKNHKPLASLLAASTKRVSSNVRGIYDDKEDTETQERDVTPKGPYEYYYQPEFTTDQTTVEALKSYSWFSATRRSVGDEDIGFVVLAFVKDPNWNPRVAMMGLCNNKPQAPQAGRGRRRFGPQPNPFFNDWVEGTNSSHISKNGFDEKKWNTWAGLYLSKTFSSSVDPTSQFKDVDEEEEEEEEDNGNGDVRREARYNLGEEEDTQNDGSRLSFMDGHSTSAFEGLDGIEDPEEVFTLSNAMRWLKTFGGDTSPLQTSIKTHQGDESTRGGHYYHRRQATKYEGVFKGSQFYRIPYRTWIWGTADLAGLNRSYFPWCEDPLIAFIKHDVLCIKEVHPSEKKSGYTICVRSIDPATPYQQQAPTRAGRIRKTIKIKEVFVKHSMGEKDLMHMQELRRHRSTNHMAETNNFTLDSLDVPDSRVIKRMLQAYNDPTKSPFKTQLTADKVIESVQSCLNKKNDGLSALSQNNSVLMLHERLSTIFDLVIEEKVKEDVAANLQNGRSDTITSQIFDKCGIFSDQFARYCKLRESFEDMACEHLDATLMSSAAILTKANQALVQYHQRCLKTVDFGFVRHDMAGSSFSNYLDKLALEVRFLLNIPHATHHFVLTCLGLMDAYRFAYNLHWNLLNTGDAATSKSHISEAVLKALVEKTVTYSDEATPRAYNIETEDLTDQILYMDEASGSIMQGGNSGKGDSCDPRATAFKKMLTTCQLALTLFVMLETPDGRKIRGKKDLYTNIMGCFMISGNKVGFDDATKTRFYRSMFGKIVIKFTSTISESTKVDYEAIMNSFLNSAAAGKDPYDLVSSPDVENLLDQFEECAQEVYKEVTEQQDAERRMLSKEGDLKMALHAPVTNVPQAMCLETFTGSADSPFLQTQTSKALTDRVKLAQVLFNYVFKMIMVYALPDVNLTLAHMIVLKYFAFLKTHGNVGLDNYRVYLRILIMCRIVTIMDAMLQVFAVEGCDVAPGGPLFIGLLKSVKPYMFCTERQTIWAMTLLADEYINPYNSAVIKVLGWNCCNYPNPGKITELSLKSWETLKDALECLELRVFDDGLVNYLEYLIEKHADNPATVKILDRILQSIPDEVLQSISALPVATMDAQQQQQQQEQDVVDLDSTSPIVSNPVDLYPSEEDDEGGLSEEEIRLVNSRQSSQQQQ